MIFISRAARCVALASFLFGLACLPVASFGQNFIEDAKPKTIIKNPILLGLEGGPKKPAEKLLTATLKPVKGAPGDLKPGDEVVLSLTVNVPEGSYTYSTTTPKGGATRIEVGKLAGLEPVDENFTATTEPETSFSPEFDGFVEKYKEPVTWTRTYRLKKETKAAAVQVSGTVHSQLCDDNTCRIKKETYEVALVAAATNSVVHQERPKSATGKPRPSEVTATLSPSQAKPGEKVTLTIQVALDEGWHTYSITQKVQIGSQPTLIKIEEAKNLKPLGEGFEPNHPFEKKIEDLGIEKLEQEIHHGTIAWTREYEVLPNAESEGFAIQGQIDYQTCKTSCIPNTVAFNLPSSNSQVAVRGGNDADLAPSAAPLESTSEPDATTESTDAREARLLALLGNEGESGSSSGPVDNPHQEKGLVWFVITAVLAGFGALLTPCVYPMVPITISFFLKQSEKQHHRPVTLALVYCGGIIATFTGLGLMIAAVFQATDLNQLANNIWLNLLLTAVITFFGISMLGVFEIHVPSWVLTWSAGKESKGGIIGTLFMALTFTLVSFTCTFAFAGGLLVMASKGEVFWPILGMLAFSGAFAFPFFLLALFPKMLSRLPKSGGWMNIIKVSMGFLEIGAALKFLSVADAMFFGQPTYLTYNIVLFAWFVLALLSGFYPLGLFRMPHDMPGKFTFGRLAFAAPFLALAGMLGTALFTSYQPSGWVWDNIAAFAPPRFEGGAHAGSEETAEVSNVEVAEIGPYLEHDNLPYALDFFKALDYARKTNQPLFIDFTGQNCINCRKMELTVLPQVRDRLKKFVRVQLFLDQVPLIEDSEEQRQLVKLNARLQHALEDVSLPGYVVLNPHDVAENGKLKRLSHYFGLEQKPGEFASFLDQGWEKFQEQADSSKVQTATSRLDSPRQTVQR